MMDSRKKLIAITGGIGSGKSTVGSMIKDRGYPVIDTDRIARDLVIPGSAILTEVIDIFGDQVILPDGRLDRKKVADIVFSDHSKRRLLESVLHPAIGETVNRLSVEAQGDHVFVLIPLVFEADLIDSYDSIWLCYCPLEIRLDRVMKRDGVSREQVLARMNAQIPDEDKLDRSDLVIDTSGNIEDTGLAVNRALETLGKG